jgi:hypothetical protein
MPGTTAPVPLLPQQREYALLPVRFDVSMLNAAAAAAPDVNWLRHAFEACAT